MNYLDFIIFLIVVQDCNDYVSKEVMYFFCCMIFSSKVKYKKRTKESEGL